MQSENRVCSVCPTTFSKMSLDGLKTKVEIPKVVKDH